jgi:YwiC-like protein
MAYPAAEFRIAANGRIKALLWPREHGAWGILLVPLVTGAFAARGVGDRLGPVLLFAVAALGLFCLRTPVESLLGTTPMRAQTPRERKAAASMIAGMAVISGVALAVLLWLGNRGLLPVGLFAACAFAAQAGVKKLGRGARMPSQIVGALGLTSTAAAAYCIVTGRLDSNALVLWLANWLFASDQVHFVQLRIHAARASGWAERFAQGRVFFFGQVVMIIVVALFYWGGWLPRGAAVAFVPVSVRGFAWFFAKPRPLLVHRLGKTELAHAITFGVLLIVGYRLG